MKKETVEEFLARGGKINGGSFDNKQPIKIPNDYSNEEFENKLHNFYQSKDWKELRKKVRQNLINMCSVCGSEHNLIVDHINPVRHFWEQRLDQENLQILCDDCNNEKGSMINWTKEWHIKNKTNLEGIRLQIEETKKEKEKIKKLKRDNSPETYAGMEEWEKMALNACFNSYLTYCKKYSMSPVNKFQFRKFIECQLTNIVRNTWFYEKEIKSYIKKNYKNIN